MLLRSLVAALVVILVGGSFWASPRPAQAYSCPAIPSVEGSVAGAELVVVGMVQEISEGTPLEIGDETKEVVLPGYDLTIAVEEYLKGSGDATIVVHDDLASVSVFRPDAEGKSYLLFLRDNGSGLRTNICMGSTEIDPGHVPAAVEQIRQIVAGAAPETETAPAADLPTSGAGTGDSDGGWVWVITGVAAVAALGFAGAAALAWRGARRNKSA